MSTSRLPTDMLRAGLIYGTGDTVAAWLTGNFSWHRCIGMTLIGALLYAPEIRSWFGWIARRFEGAERHRAQWSRALLALLWFNPLWIARHALFIRLTSGNWQGINANLLTVGATAFLYNFPVALAANWLIQNRIALRWRLTASAAFSAMMAIWYALAEVWFG